MKKLLTIILAALTALTACFALTACGSNKESGNETKKEKLIVYTEAGFAPFEFKEKGKIDVIGVDIEIAKYIANKYNYELEIVDGSFDTIVAGIDEDNALGIAGISWTAEREKAVEYSDFYFGGTFQTVIYKKDSNPTLEEGVFAIANFEGKSVVYQSGTTGNNLVNENKTEWKVKEAKGFVEYAAALEEVKTAKETTYLVVDSYVAAQFCANDDSIAYATIEGVEAESYGVVAKKGNTALIEKVNVCIAELLVKDADGKTQIDKWYAQYDAIEAED